MTRTLQEWLDVIGREIDFVDVKPYSHNIISLALLAIAKNHGHDKANEVIDDFKLELLGWKKVDKKGLLERKSIQ